MPKKLKRYYGLGHVHFITFSCHRRTALLGTARARNLFLHALSEVRSQYEFALVGYVVMPEHVETWVTPARGASSSGHPSE